MPQNSPSFFHVFLCVLQWPPWGRTGLPFLRWNCAQANQACKLAHISSVSKYLLVSTWLHSHTVLIFIHWVVLWGHSKDSLFLKMLGPDDDLIGFLTKSCCLWCLYIFVCVVLCYPWHREMPISILLCNNVVAMLVPIFCFKYYFFPYNQSTEVLVYKVAFDNTHFLVPMIALTCCRWYGPLLNLHDQYPRHKSVGNT